MTPVLVRAVGVVFAVLGLVGGTDGFARNAGAGSMGIPHASLYEHYRFDLPEEIGGLR